MYACFILHGCKDTKSSGNDKEKCSKIWKYREKCLSTVNKFLPKYLQICHRRCNYLVCSEFGRWQIFQKVTDKCHFLQILTQFWPVFAVFHL